MGSVPLKKCCCGKIPVMMHRQGTHPGGFYWVGCMNKQCPTRPKTYPQWMSNNEWVSESSAAKAWNNKS